MTENQALISQPQTENQEDLSISLKEKVFAQIKAGEFVEALETAQKIEIESHRVEALKILSDAAYPDGGEQVVALKALLLLPMAERNAILAKQVEAVKDCFLPGSEEMEWVEEYVENDNWDEQF